MERLTQTLLCTRHRRRQGRVEVHIIRRRSDDPYLRRAYISWEYTACFTWEYGTIDGTASYDREQNQQDGMLVRKVNYRANPPSLNPLDRSCNTYSHLEQRSFTDQWLPIGLTCPHPVKHWWEVMGL